MTQQNKVTPDQIQALKDRVTYVPVHRPGGSTSTFVHAYLDGKFLLATGFSAWVDPNEYREELGYDYALKDLAPKLEEALWKYEGYALYTKLNTPSTFRTRLDEEHRELSERTTKLHEFLQKPKPDHISDYHWTLRHRQYDAMESYLVILGTVIQDLDAD